MTRWSRLGMCVALLFLCAHCQPRGPQGPEPESPGGGESPTVEEALDEELDEELEEEGDEEEASEPEPEAAASGPATVTVSARVKGEQVPASVRLLDGGGKQVASAKAGEPITAEPGQYTLEIAIEDEKVLADRPVQRSAIALSPGSTVEHPVEFPWASIQLRVRVNGAVDKGAKVDITRAGEVVTTIQSDAAHVLLSPGRYGAKVRTRGAVIEVEQLMFPQGATRTLPVDVQM